MKKTAAAVALTLTLAAAAAGQTSRKARRAGPAEPSKAKESGDEVERLLVRCLMAHGGVSLFKLKTRIMRGRVEMSQSPVPGSFESYEKFPNMQMSIINAPMGQFITAKDGVSHWHQAPWGSVTGVVVAGSSEDLLSRPAKGKDGFKFRNAFAASRLKGRARVEGRETIVLAATPKGREPMLMYFDAETYLLYKQEPERPAGAGGEKLAWAVYIDSYATVDGVKVPALFRLVTKPFTMTFRATEVKHNVKIDDGLFRGPEGK